MLTADGGHRVAEGRGRAPGQHYDDLQMLDGGVPVIQTVEGSGHDSHVCGETRGRGCDRHQVKPFNAAALVQQLQPTLDVHPRQQLLKLVDV